MEPELSRPSFEEFLLKYRYYFLILLAGLILVGFGVFSLQNKLQLSSGKVEVLEGSTESQVASFLVAEINGAVEKSGVYKLPAGSRVDDLIVAAGGFSADADRVWVEKNLNRAAKISDGQKVYIPTLSESANQQSQGASAENSTGYQTISGGQGSGLENLVNINTASLSELDKLPGIGPVYGQNIIDHRPYSKIEELTEKGVLKQSVYDKVKMKITVN